MSAPELGPWEPLDVESVVEVFVGAPFRWWISGGRALDLHLQRSWRDHDDTDLGVLRSDLAAVHERLGPWEAHIAAAGKLSPWRGEPLRSDRHQNNVWCRRTDAAPWILDITIGDGSDEEWIYRRDPSIRVPWNMAVLHSVAGIPYLAPELQLLYKSTAIRPKDDIDAAVVIPTLDDRQLELLAATLAPDHPWRSLLEP